MKILGLIGARGGSKGLPGKNIKKLAGVPLIGWSIKSGLSSKKIDKLIVSTDCKEIASIAKEYKAEVPFLRPTELASDEASSYSFIRHAVDYFLQSNETYDYLVLLQPTTPFRKEGDIDKMIDLAQKEPDVDMVVSVVKSKANPYYNLFEEDKDGYLQKCKQSVASRRQDVKEVYEINGSVYVIKTTSLLEKGTLNFDKVLKFEMSSEYSIDIDNQMDFDFAEFMYKKVSS
ncbi:MAG: acylneuraminate cytidylyltransferase family protein [Flavobacteriales bacterium]|nr:acylneuraminate cytidylyltransferase family protein [Flavobacteriales bacterium]